MTFRSNWVLAFALFVSATIVRVSSDAATLTVTSAANAGGTCPGADCTLRQAIATAATGDTISFSLPANSVISLATQLMLNKSLTIAGPRANLLTVERAATAQPFEVIRIMTTGVTVSGITLSGGSGAFGGAIYATSSFTLRDCTLSGNSASFGAAIMNAGSARTIITNCTFSGNTASNSGGAIFQAGGELVIINSTISENMCSNTGGGIYNGAAITVRNCTIYNNTGSAGAGIANDGVASKIGSTIVGGNTATDPNTAARDVSGNFVSEGYNLVSTNAAANGFTAPGDRVGTAAFTLTPGLGPLQDNGGPTKTHTLLAGSPAIDNGRTAVDADGQPLNMDQRGQPRPADRAESNAAGGDGSDIGAVELGLLQTGPAFTVTTILERNDTTCTTDDCTLYEALTVANLVDDANTINFAPGLAGAIGTAIITPTGLPITKPVTINGPGARVLGVTGRTSARVFDVTSQNVHISGLSLLNGRVTNTDGGIIRNTGGLTLTECSLTNGYAATAGVGDGGAIHNALGATLTLANCTINDSKADNAGGGIFNEGTVSATNCTFSNNSAFQGGAIYSAFSNNTSKVGLRNCTIIRCVANDAGTGTGDGGGGFYAVGNSGQYNLGNSIIAHNDSHRNPDLRGNFFSDGHNLVRLVDASTGLSAGVKGDQVGDFTVPKDPLLVTALANNGGPTDTHALQSGSTARDNGDDALAPPADQREYGRNGVSDIGAFEFKGLLPATLANISTRLRVETGDNVLIGGFIITGTEQKKVMIRAIGPSLAQFFSDTLSDPTLELRDGLGGLVDSNDNWADSPNKQAIFDTGISPSNNAEAAIIATLPANAAGYTAIVRGAAGATGIGVVEAYDLDRSVNSKLANISTRGLVQTGNNVLIAGTIVVGSQSQRVIVRAIGPSLPIPGRLENPTLELRNQNGGLLDANDNWVESANKQEIADTGIAPSNNFESAIVRTLSPASYTAVVRGVSDAMGIAVVEVYALQ
jgi:predicted outer membrane repeat protein